jgi:hypothetical protein
MASNVQTIYFSYTATMNSDVNCSSELMYLLLVRWVKHPHLFTVCHVIDTAQPYSVDTPKGMRLLLATDKRCD